ncbi:MAG TPA: tagaturonate epimerase family protein, partial [Candidatus Limnocylindria bacterium]|nr:tagaturonate epimerase family protein [Candidatus Limnocylindria bacterium]
MENQAFDPRGVFLRKAAGGEVLVANGAERPADHAAAEWLRETFPFTRPSPVLRLERTFGVGDRLGIAGDGHLRVFKKYDAVPVLAQQSMRELKLTNRTYEDVLDCATFAVFRAGYTGPWGADGDHLKTMDEVRLALGLGYTMITLDCSEHIRGPEGRADVPQDMRDRYVGRPFPLDDGSAVSFTQDSLSQALAVYGDAISFAHRVWQEFFAGGKTTADLEISIDETSLPTSPAQHFFAASELSRLGVGMKTMAPRFIGEFQKGIDYIGDVSAFDREMQVHAAIARRFGYKISVHSGS